MRVDLRERNAKIIKRQIFEGKSFIENGVATAGREYRDQFKREWGVDPYDPAMLKEGFQWGKAAEKMAKFREAEVSSAWNALMRAGVNNVANNAYATYPTTWESWVTTVPSSKDTELYAPLHSVGFPSEVPQGGLFPEVSTAGLDLSLKNKKYGSLFAVTYEAQNDDQTGQLVQKANLMGEYLKQLTEVLVMAKLLSPSGGVTYGPLYVPTSETKPSYEANYPWTTSASPFVGGGYNRPSSFGIVNDTNLKAGIQAMMQQKDLLGNFMAVDPSHILVSPKRRFDIATILNSEYYPAGAQSAGVTGGAFSKNQLKGLLDPLFVRYMPKSTGVVDGLAETWMLVDAAKPAFVMQMREGVSVVAEAPNSGQGFERQIQRFRAHMRGNADFIDPRFMWLGNDGSASS
jgi:hypothetical protein